MLKERWVTNHHEAKKKELSTIFSNIPEKFFEHGIELASGDGFQSERLFNYIRKFISSEYHEEHLNKTNHEITYASVDAEKLDRYFKEQYFDLIYSSNLLEHIPDIKSCMESMHTVLKNDGICIHIMPNPTWKFGHFILFYPRQALRVLHKIFYGRTNANITNTRSRTNNPKKFSHKTRGLKKLFIPRIHGVSENNLAEILAFRKSKWISEIEQHGFNIIKVRKGPFSIVYFSQRVNTFFERLGFSTEYIYFMVKKEQGPEITQRYLSMFF